MTKKLLGLIVTVIIVLALAGGVAWVFVSGKLVWNGNGVQPSGVKIVCGDEIVTTFNQAREAVVREDGGVETVDTEGQKQVAADVQKLDGYQNDPTCQTIVFWVSYQDGNYEATKTAYEAIASLHDQHIYADNNLSGVETMQTYEAMVAGLSPENVGKGTNGDE